VQEVTRQDRGRLGGQELPPGRGCPAWRGREPGGGQDPADRSGAEPVPEAEELALDAPVSPARVLPGQQPDQLMDLLRDGRPSGGVRVGPLVLDQAPVPVGFQNSAIGLDLGFYAARSYSLRRPPRTGRRLIRSRERSATG
jgi:hypothetical protein